MKKFWLFFAAAILMTVGYFLLSSKVFKTQGDRLIKKAQDIIDKVKVTIDETEKHTQKRIEENNRKIEAIESEIDEIESRILETAKKLENIKIKERGFEESAEHILNFIDKDDDNSK